jgi:hypothetical protein
MSRTFKYFLQSLGKTIVAIAALAAYMYGGTYVLINYAGLDQDISYFLVFVVPMFGFGISLLWDSAKHKAKMENLELIRKIRD